MDWRQMAVTSINASSFPISQNMDTESIPEAQFIREFTKEIHNKNAAVFAGSGLSMSTGFVDWKGLLAEVIRDLGLDPTKEHDLVTVAQYSVNSAGENKTRLAQTILDHFATTREPTENHAILARLPIHTYWTTNYDRLIEKSLETAKKGFLAISSGNGGA
jgi:NAD-dependent SIR2 family protein deacetylase